MQERLMMNVMYLINVVTYCSGETSDSMGLSRIRFLAVYMLFHCEISGN